MQSFKILHSLILIWLTTTLIEAHDSRKPGCSDKCGEVRVPYPFGIGRDCSADEWFTVDCNSSIPYLPALNNVEVLVFHEDANRFTVNMSIIKADCKNPVVNSRHVLSTSHGESPFRFSGLHNIFVVQGCGRATVMDEDGYSTIAGCSTTCSNDTVSDINNCFGSGCCQTRIVNGNFKSFTFDLTRLESQDADMACKSAFLVDLEYIGTLSSQLIVKDHTFVPISLSSVSWNKTFNYSSGCNDVCGGILIPYPFGIGRDCSFSDWFNVDCKSSIPYLSKLNNLEVLAVNAERKTVLVDSPYINSCENPLPNGSLVLNGSPFVFSKWDNMFLVRGCGTAVIMDKNGTTVSGCSTTCGNATNATVSEFKNCFGVGCCQTIVPDHLDSFYLNLIGFKSLDGTCAHGSGYLVDAFAYPQRRFYEQVPVTLWWSESTERISPECLKCLRHGGSCYPSPFVTSGTSCHFYGNSKKRCHFRYPFFQQRSDARGRMGFSGLQKCTAAMRMMAYGISADGLDEYLQMSERTARESMYQFSRGVVETFGDVYLRGPTTNDVEKLYAAHEERHGFPGMLGSLDCTHWDWRNCPTAWKGMYTGGHHGCPSLVLEAVASQDLWIWHAYFGVPGSHNDRNVLDSSPIFEDLIQGKAPDAPFHVNGHPYTYPYYLTDGIYPKFATFVKVKRLAHDDREETFTKRQAAARKDVERAFGVLKAKWHIVMNAARPYHLDNLKSIMYACIIMHNMIIEEEGRHICPYVEDDPRPVLYPVGSDEYRRRYVDIQNPRVHDRLHNDLVTHIFYNPRHVEDVEVAPPVVPDDVGQFDDVPDDELRINEDEFDELEDYDDVVDDD